MLSSLTVIAYLMTYETHALPKKKLRKKRGSRGSLFFFLEQKPQACSALRTSPFFVATLLLLRQYLTFCTSKASKLSTRGGGPVRAAGVLPI